MLKCIESTTWGRNLDYEYLLWVYRKAVTFGLKGIAFFKNDGSIKVVAEGEEKNLVAFVQKLKRGRHLFHLFAPENFSVVWHEPRKEFDDFSISQTGE